MWYLTSAFFLRRRLKVWYRCAACCYHTFIKRIHLYYHAREKYTHVGVSQKNGESGQRGCFFCQQRTGVGSAHDIRALLAHAAREGVLSPSDMLEVLATARSAIYVGRLLEKLDAEAFPLFHNLGAGIPRRPHIVRRI